MNRIHRKVEYALIALKHMRQKAPGERTTVKEIAAAYGCPHDVTARVLQALANRGFLNSEQGAHGGYMLSRDLGRVSFHDLMTVILGPIGVARCLHDEEGLCEIKSTCNIVSPIQALNRKMVEFYKSLSVAELIDSGRAGSSREVAISARDGSAVAEAQ